MTRPDPSPKSPTRWRIPFVAALLAPLALAACFVSETPLIPAGEGVLPIDDPITICVETSQPCLRLVAEGDGYRTRASTPGGEGGQVRFAPLIAANGTQTYILEAKDDSEPGYLYAIARRARTPAPGGSTIEIAGIDCDDLSEAAETLWVDAGGTRRGGIVSECQAPSLEVMRAAFQLSFGAALGSEEWWQDNGPR